MEHQHFHSSLRQKGTKCRNYTIYTQRNEGGRVGRKERDKRGEMRNEKEKRQRMNERKRQKGIER